ncbi:MAG: MATE family efflux transporter, partial [Eubacteriales bacterium]|nr:MATE family efflux transporter [Eubacteriales bacterium]
VVGQVVGKEALAAVGTTSSIINTLVGFAAGLSTGASVVISQCYGSHDHKGLHHAVHTSICVTFLLGAAFTAVGILGADTLLRLQFTPEDVFTEAHTYLTIYFSGMLGLLTDNMGSGILRAVGDSRRPLYFLVFSAIVNTILDLVFVVLLGMGVEGVAYATIIAQFLSVALTLWVLTRDHAPYGIHWGHLSIDVPTLKRIISIGLPSGIQQAITSFSNVFVQGYINFFGSACMAGWSSYNKLDAFILIPMQAIAMASTTFVGQNYGAQKIDRARKGVRDAQILSISITILCSVVMVAFARPLSTMFSNEKEVLDFSQHFITLQAPFYFLMCYNQTYSGALRGVGKSTIPMLLMLFSFVLFRQTYLFVIKNFFGNPLTGIAVAYPVGWAMCSLLLTIYYRTTILGKRSAAPQAEQA